MSVQCSRSNTRTRKSSDFRYFLLFMLIYFVVFGSVTIEPHTVFLLFLLYTLSIMVSEKTLRWTATIIRVGSFFKIFPAIWDPQEQCVRPNYGKYTFFSWTINTGKLLQVIYLLSCISIGIYFIILLSFLEHNKLDLYFSIFALFCLTLTLVAQLNFYYRSDDIFRVYNSIMILDKRLRKYKFCSMCILDQKCIMEWFCPSVWPSHLFKSPM